MIRFDHRISKDIDLFTHDAQALGLLSPQLNQTAERESTEYHQQANALKLVRPEGDIDFIVAAPIIPNARPEVCEVAGRQIVLDHTAEILAKKLAYRADSFKVRDVFDMATVLALDRPSAMSAIRATLRTRPALMDRLLAMQAHPSSDYEKDLAMTGSGRQYAVDMFPTLVEAIRMREGSASDQLVLPRGHRRAEREPWNHEPDIREQTGHSDAAQCRRERQHGPSDRRADRRDTPRRLR